MIFYYYPFNLFYVMCTIFTFLICIIAFNQFDSLTSIISISYIYSHLIQMNPFIVVYFIIFIKKCLRRAVHNIQTFHMHLTFTSQKNPFHTIIFNFPHFTSFQCNTTHAARHTQYQTQNTKKNHAHVP